MTPSRERKQLYFQVIGIIVQEISIWRHLSMHKRPAGDTQGYLLSRQKRHPGDTQKYPRDQETPSRHSGDSQEPSRTDPAGKRISCKILQPFFNGSPLPNKNHQAHDVFWKVPSALGGPKTPQRHPKEAKGSQREKIYIKKLPINRPSGRY